ncbi:MAG: alpha/beta hydrolase [Firmicutes bacterium]|nr:alpha/beta hydrolase [Bacillota bacterium]
MSKKYKNNLEFKKSAMGEFVSIDENEYSVFVTGHGEDTLIFMAGEGVPSPILDFKPLWSLLEDKFKIVVLEKAGYGWSDVTNKNRDIGTLVSDNQKMLKVLNIAAPYILVAHSYSGLEAVYWAQNYKDEIKAIISLDMTLPVMVNFISIPTITKLAFVLFSMFPNVNIGHKRATKLIKKLPSFNLLESEDKETYLNVLMHRFMTKNMINEIKMMVDNAKYIENKEHPKNTPILFFSSNLIDAAKSAKMSVDELLQLHKNFVAKFFKAKHIQLDCDHFVHAYFPKKIEEEIKIFISEINSQIRPNSIKSLANILL